jgi:hypothetical protein
MSATTAYVINLDKNPERWSALQTSWKGAFTLHRVPAVETVPGWKGCALSHIKCIEEAKTRGDPFVLVWEDDCIPRVQSYGEPKNPRVTASLWKTLVDTKLAHSKKWDIVIGATSAVRKGAFLDPELSSATLQVYKLEHGFTTHWTLYNHTIYDKMIAWKTNQSDPIDVYMYKHAKVHVTLPFLAEQREGWSMIEQRQTDYHKYFNEAEHVLSRAALQVNTKMFKLIQ